MNEAGATAVDGGQVLVKTLTIRNELGLHARAAAKFVKVAGQFEASFTVSRAGTSVSGHSILGLMMLAAGPGSEISIKAEGPQADAGLIALTALIEAKFEED